MHFVAIGRTIKIDATSVECNRKFSELLPTRFTQNNADQRKSLYVDFLAFGNQIDTIRLIRFSSDSGIFEFTASERYPENIEISQSINCG